MSRAMIVAKTEAEVLAKCSAKGIKISTIETMADGKTRLVCVTGEGAETMRAALKGYVQDKTMRRFPFDMVISPD